jgi:hypothetical protein
MIVMISSFNLGVCGREAKRQAAEREEQRRLEVERMRELASLSRMHYARACLVYRGVLPWRRLVKVGW